MRYAVGKFQAICGVHIPQSLAYSIGRYQCHLLRHGIPLKPTPIDNLHVTICHMRPIESPLVPSISEEVTALDFHPMLFQVQKIGFWQPNILYLKLAACEESIRVHAELTTALCSMGVRVVRAQYFSPHITIGRVSSEYLEGHGGFIPNDFSTQYFFSRQVHLLSRNQTGELLPITTVNAR